LANIAAIKSDLEISTASAEHGNRISIEVLTDWIAVSPDVLFIVTEKPLKSKPECWFWFDFNRGHFP